MRCLGMETAVIEPAGGKLNCFKTNAEFMPRKVLCAHESMTAHALDYSVLKK